MGMIKWNIHTSPKNVLELALQFTSSFQFASLKPPELNLPKQIDWSRRASTVVCNVTQSQSPRIFLIGPYKGNIYPLPPVDNMEEEDPCALRILIGVKSSYT